MHVPASNCCPFNGLSLAVPTVRRIIIVYILCFVVAFLGASTLASKIKFQATPTEMTPPLTTNLKLRCGLLDTKAPSNVLIGKRQQQLVETPYNVAHVTSIIITRGYGEHIATITQYQAATALADKGQLIVNGSVNGTNGDQAYLELTWPIPGLNQSNSYMCEVNAVDDVGHNVIFSTMVEVGNHIPDINALAQSVHTLQREKNDLIHNLTSLHSTLLQLQSAMSQLKPHHTERGVGGCYDSDQWPLDPNDKDFHVQLIRVNFAKPYDEVPVISVGITRLDIDRDHNTRVDIQVKTVTKTYFEVECQTWVDTYMYSVEFDWMSVVA